MATTEEIRRRVEEADTARSAKRSAAAQQIGELAQRRAAVAEELHEIERQLGDVLAAATGVMDIKELAQFTDISTADLTRWLNARTVRKPTRAKRKRPANAADAPSDTSRAPSAASTPTAGESTVSEPAAPGAGAADAPARVTAEMAWRARLAISGPGRDWSACIRRPRGGERRAAHPVTAEESSSS
jgi:hypothetical protein